MKTQIIVLAALCTITMGLNTSCSKKLQTAFPTPASPLRVASHPGAKVFIVEPKNGQTMTSPVTVKFGMEGIELAKAGEVKENSGHYHLLIDLETLPPLDQALPFNDHVLHFGQAQTETAVQLSPGPHTLQLILAAGNHVPHNPPVISEKITINIQ
ncbi:MAG: DUF4399 domain-containing protein [Deltaproteobacteria bacterium]|nr:DUF4399 domain-containing protein [Deltaproteobacteria bacterium]